jgi:hypothetical protein
MTPDYQLAAQVRIVALFNGSIKRLHIDLLAVILRLLKPKPWPARTSSDKHAACARAS